MRRLWAALLVLATLVVVAGASLVAVAAVAAPVPETGEVGMLTLDADPYPAQNLTIQRGERVLWPVTAELVAPTTGELTVRVASAQPLAENPEALRFELASCPEPWALPPDMNDSAMCAGGSGTVQIADAAFATTDAGEVFPLGDIVPGEPRYLLVTLSLPMSTPGAVAEQPAELSFGFVAHDAVHAQAARLAETGGGLLGIGLLGPALLGGGLLLGGAAVARMRRREPVP